MYMRALEGKEEEFGAKHTSTLDTVNNIGVLYSDQGKLDEAEKMFRQALEGYEEAIGIENMQTYIPALNAMKNLADLVSNTRAEESRIMYRKALAGFITIRGASSDVCLDLSQRLDALDLTKWMDVDPVQATSSVDKP